LHALRNAFIFKIDKTAKSLGMYHYEATRQSEFSQGLKNLSPCYYNYRDCFTSFAMTILFEFSLKHQNQLDNKQSACTCQFISDAERTAAQPIDGLKEKEYSFTKYFLPLFQILFEAKKAKIKIQQSEFSIKKTKKALKFLKV